MKIKYILLTAILISFITGWFWMPYHHEIEIRVNDMSGQPMDNVVATITETDPESTWSYTSTAYNGIGYLRNSNIDPGKEYIITARKTGYITQSITVTTDESQACKDDLVLEVYFILEPE